MGKIGAILKIVGPIIGGAAFGAGAVYLWDKSKLDDLQDQVVTLQEKNKKLVELLEDRDNQIEKMIVRCKIASIESVLSDSDNEKLKVVLKYAIKDYADIYVKRINESDVYENDMVFFKGMDDFIEGREVSDDTFKLIISRVYLRYGTQIEGYVDPDYDSIIDQLKGSIK